MLGIGLLGCGRIARMLHLHALVDMDEVELCMVAESDPERLREASAIAAGSVAFDDYREALADDRLEAVVICLPTGLHAEAASAAFEAGKHVFLEKPIATSEADARRVLKAWTASGRVGMMGFNQRFHPVIRDLKGALGANRAGTVVGAHVIMGSETREFPDWKRSRASGGGALLELGSHVVDLSRYLFEREVVSVGATIASVHTEQDTAALSMRLEGGPTVQAHVTLSGIQEGRYEIVGDRGRIVADRVRETLTLDPVRPPYGRVANLRAELSHLSRGLRKVVNPPSPWHSHRAALSAFVDAVTNGQGVEPDIEDGCRSLAVILAAEESDRTGRNVAVRRIGR